MLKAMFYSAQKDLDEKQVSVNRSPLSTFVTCCASLQLFTSAI